MTTKTREAESNQTRTIEQHESKGCAGDIEVPGGQRFGLSRALQHGWGRTALVLLVFATASAPFAAAAYFARTAIVATLSPDGSLFSLTDHHASATLFLIGGCLMFLSLYRRKRLDHESSGGQAQLMPFAIAGRGVGTPDFRSNPLAINPRATFGVKSAKGKL